MSAELNPFSCVNIAAQESVDDRNGHYHVGLDFAGFANDQGTRRRVKKAGSITIHAQCAFKPEFARRRLFGNTRSPMLWVWFEPRLEVFQPGLKGL